MTTVTLPREVVQQALDVISMSQEFVQASSNAKLRHGWGNQLDEAERTISTLRAALEALAQPVDCRGCTYYRNGLVGRGCYVSLDEGKRMLCTNGDKFEPLEPIQLYKQEK